MSWKSIVITGLLCVVAAPVFAAPTIRVADGGLVSGTNRVFNVFVTPDPTRHSVDTNADTIPDSSGMAVELGFSVLGSTIVNATTTAAWQDDLIAPMGNTGNNPFSNDVTEGIVIGAGGANVFAALGSSANASGLLQTETQVLSIELSSAIGVLVLEGIYNVNGGQGGNMAILAQDGANFGVGGRFGIFGDFDANGRVEGGDLGPFAGQFGLTGLAPYESFADSNGDGNVDGGDLGPFAGRFGLSAPGSPFPASGGGSLSGAGVPEPASAGIMVIGLIVAGFVRLRTIGG